MADLDLVRLLQAGKAYFPHIGGVETVMRLVAEGAVAAGWESRVLVAGDDFSGAHERRDDVEVVRVGSLGRVLSLPIAPGYGRALRHEEADALLVHEPTLLAALAAFGHRAAFRRRFGRILVWWHSDIVRQRVASPAYRPVVRNLLELADQIIVATPHHVTSSDTLPAYERKTLVIPYGVDLRRYAPSPERAARVAALRATLPEQPLVVYAGRLARYKGIDVLADAMEHIGDAHLVVAGRGPVEDALRSSNAFRAGRVTLLPHLDETAFVDLLWAADLFVLPSTQNSEAFGIVQLEAMACETPVVTFDLPTGVTWVNRHDETGIVVRGIDPVRLAHGINRLLDDEQLRCVLGKQARKRVEETFDVKQSVAAVLDACDSSATRVPALQSVR